MTEGRNAIRAMPFRPGLGGPKGPEPHSRLRADARHPYRGPVMGKPTAGRRCMHGWDSCWICESAGYA